MYMPKIYLEEIQKRIRELIWDGKTPKVKYSTLINSVEDAGLALQEVECKLKTKKIKCIQNINDEKFTAPWKSYLSSKIHGNINHLPRYN
jgi:hypothetical protein